MRVKIVTIFSLFLFFLPLTQALTINIAFPLKLSELVLLVLIFIFVGKIIAQKKFTYPSSLGQLLILFFIWATLSFTVNTFWKYNYPLKAIPFRINAFGDSLLRLCYIALNFLAFFVSLYFIKKTPSVIKYWVYGALLASIYAWYLFLFSGLNLPYFKVFGMEENPQSLNGFIRCGTFKEGNFFGLYLLLSAVISFYLKKNKIGFFLLISIITTFSTISIISSIVFIIFVFRRLFLKKKIFFITLTLLPLLALSSIFLIRTQYFNTYIYSKLSTPSNILTPTSFSKVDRTMTARIGYFQGINNPFFGVGPYNYGLHYDEYNDFRNYITNNNNWSLDYFERENKRIIPNNVYIEIFAEYGIIGFLFFTGFLTRILILSFKNKNDILTGGIIAILISFNAFPSFIMLFIWTFFAIPLAIKHKNE